MIIAAAASGLNSPPEMQKQLFVELSAKKKKQKKENTFVFSISVHLNGSFLIQLKWKHHFQAHWQTAASEDQVMATELRLHLTSSTADVWVTRPKRCWLIW